MVDWALIIGAHKFNRFQIKLTMALRSRMHPRNIYKKPPNFKELAIQYPEFRKYITQDLSGRVFLDYNDRNAVRELTKVLMLKDFNLRVEINESRLIPRVPLCLNYVLWVEDLLVKVHSQQVTGIDIGTGSACIYSLLCSTKGWKMLATEIDRTSFESANLNVQNNNLGDRIMVKFVENPEKLLIGVIDENQCYDFCMCNPPFFGEQEKVKNRTRKRKMLETTASFVDTDIKTSGGEVNFIKRIIAESEILKDKIKIYTTLVGKKADLSVIKKEILNIKPAAFIDTEFCQGNTIRWGVAWSFLNIDFGNNYRSEVVHQNKSTTKVLQYVIQKTDCDMNESIKRVENILSDLKVKFLKEDVFEKCIFTIKAYENTWSHQRRKNRLKKHIEADRVNDVSEVEKEKQLCKKPKIETSETSALNNEVLVECLLSLELQDECIILEMSWLSGSKDSVHQILQYFKNNWSKVSEASVKGEER